MIETSALLPVSEAIAALLNTAALRDLGVTVWDEIPADSPFPTVGYTVTETPWRSMAQPGQAVELRLHTFTQYEGMRTAHQIIDIIVGLLGTAVSESMPMAGWIFQWADYQGTIPLPDEIINGQLTQHLQARWLLIVTAHATESPASRYAASVLADGATHAWRLNDVDAATAADAIGSVDGALSPTGITIAQAGIFDDFAMTFLGDPGRVTLPLASFLALGPTQSASWECWVKPVAFTGGPGFYQVLIDTGFDRGVYVTLGYNGIYWQLFDGVTSYTFARGCALGVWSHVVCVVDRATSPNARVYVNGSVGGGAAMPDGLDFSGIGGAFLFGSGNYLDATWIGYAGGLDEIAFYPFALTPAQIAAHYALGSGG